jgi:hypothetical protein
MLAGRGKTVQCVMAEATGYGKLGARDECSLLLPQSRGGQVHDLVVLAPGGWHYILAGWGAHLGLATLGGDLFLDGYRKRDMGVSFKDIFSLGFAHCMRVQVQGVPHLLLWAPYQASSAPLPILLNCLHFSALSLECRSSGKPSQTSQVCAHSTPTKSRPCWT